jgi:hypothetical protein
MIAPALADLREVCQPSAKLQSRNGEHWAGRLYMRQISLRATRQLVRTRVTPDTLTWAMVVCGIASGFGLGSWWGQAFRAAHGASNLWVSVGLAAALGVVLLKASTDLVDVARARRGLSLADDDTVRPRFARLATIRRVLSSSRRVAAASMSVSSPGKYSVRKAALS